MKKLIILLAVFLAILPTLYLIVGCQQPSTATPWTSFTNGNDVKALLVEGNALWAATSGGVVRWDTSSGTYHKYTTLDGLTDNNVMAVARDDQGNLWFGTQYGIHRYDGTNWSKFTVKDGTAGYRTMAAAQDDKGDLWFGSIYGIISRYDGTNLSIFHTLGGTQARDYDVMAIAQDNRGNLWFGTNHGVSRYDGTTWETFTTNNGLAGNSVLAIVQDNEGNLWFGTDGGASRYDGEQWSTFRTTDGLVADYVTDIVQDGRGNMWFGTDHGISRYDGKKWRTFTTNDGLVSNNIWVITQDNQGNLWFGTDRGVSRYDGTTWETFTTKDGLAGNSVGAIAQDNRGNLWFGTKGGASRYDGSNWSTFTHEDGLPYLGSYGVVTAIFQDDKGNLWFAANDGGVSCYNGTSWQAFTIGIRARPTDGVMPGPLPTVKAIAQDNKGNLWFGTNGGGVSRYDGTTWETFTSKDGLAGNSVNAILPDKQGNIWFATKSTDTAAVSCYDGTNWTTFTYKNGLLGVYANAVEEDNQGNIWVGTGTTGGVSYYDGTAWRTFTTRDGLADGDVRAVFKDRHGNLWFGTNGGVNCYDMNLETTLPSPTNPETIPDRPLELPTILTPETWPRINPGTVQLYATATPTPEKVTSVVLTISKVKLRGFLSEHTTVTSPEYLDIYYNTYTFDLLKICGVEYFLGNSEASSRIYTEVEYRVEKVEVALEGGELQEAELPVLPEVTNGIFSEYILKDWSVNHPFELTQGEATDLVVCFDTEKSLRLREDKVPIFKPVVNLDVRPKRFRYIVPEDTAVHITEEDFWNNRHENREIEVTAGETFTIILGTDTRPSRRRRE